MSGRDLNLDGGEIAIIKALGLGGTELTGKDLMSRVSELVGAELLDTLKGLIALGYVNADKSSFQKIEEMETVHFQVNPGYSKQLREAMDPRPEKKSRRVRRE